MKHLYNVDPLDFKTLYEFRLECCESDEDGELVFANGATVFIDKNGLMNEDPKFMQDQFTALANLVKFQIQKKKNNA